MHISRVEIVNFRNFEHVSFNCGPNVVLLGENKAGKSNLLFALRLVLDPALPDSARRLRMEDFWDGLGEPGPEDKITVSVDLSDFENDEDQLALLADHLVEPSPMVARLTYAWEPKKTLKEPPSKEADYDFTVYGGDRHESWVSSDLRRRLPMELLHALRDCEADLAKWSRSPLRPLLDQAASGISKEKLDEYAEAIETASAELTEDPEIASQATKLTDQLKTMVGENQALDILFRFAPIDPARLVRSLRIFIDGGKRGVADASLGSANILFFALKMLEFQHLIAAGERQHTFLAIEEPEAHLHPHLQRLVFRNYLRLRHDTDDDDKLPEASVWVSTHSPHIASVAPIKSFVALRSNGESSSAVSTLGVDLTDNEVEDLERYLDVSRGEMLFARGVVLVEGDAEKFLLPVLAAVQNLDLDEEGISVCSISGTNFNAYAKFLKSLAIPFAVVTDKDPTDTGSLAHIRVATLVRTLTDKDLSSADEAQTFAAGEEAGIFVNSHTLEIDLFECGLKEEFLSATKGLRKPGKALERMTGWAQTNTALDKERFLADIEQISKGRFAQRLATAIKKSGNKSCPAYISTALGFLWRRLHGE